MQELMSDPTVHLGQKALELGEVLDVEDQVLSRIDRKSVV